MSKLANFCTSEDGCEFGSRYFAPVPVCHLIAHDQSNRRHRLDQQVADQSRRRFRHAQKQGWQRSGVQRDVQQLFPATRLQTYCARVRLVWRFFCWFVIVKMFERFKVFNDSLVYNKTMSINCLFFGVGNLILFESI